MVEHQVVAVIVVVIGEAERAAPCAAASRRFVVLAAAGLREAVIGRSLGKVIKASRGGHRSRGGMTGLSPGTASYPSTLSDAVLK